MFSKEWKTIMTGTVIHTISKLYDEQLGIH